MKSLVPCLIVSATLLCSTQIAHSQQPTETVKPGRIILIEGVGGVRLFRLSGVMGFYHAGLPHEVQDFSWTHGFGRVLRDLQDTRHIFAKGDELAQQILEFKRREPQRKIYIVAHSGGTGIAVRAAERLPPGTLERVVLLSSALSPRYDLRQALVGCRQGIVSYHSPWDFFILGWGTSQFGTVDREYEKSAGYGGFQIPDGLDATDRDMYDRLIQIPWSPRMIWMGNFGNHNGSVFPAFLAGEVARWLK